MISSVRIRLTETQQDDLLAFAEDEEFTYLHFPEAAMARLGDFGLAIYGSGLLPTETGEGTETGTGDGEPTESGTAPGTADGDGSETGTADGDGSEPGTADGDGSETGTADGDGSEPGTADGEATETGTGDGDGTGTGTESEGDTPTSTSTESDTPAPGTCPEDNCTSCEVTYYLDVSEQSACGVGPFGASSIMTLTQYTGGFPPGPKCEWTGSTVATGDYRAELTDRLKCGVGYWLIPLHFYTNGGPDPHGQADYRRTPEGNGDCPDGLYRKFDSECLSGGSDTFPATQTVYS